MSPVRLGPLLRQHEARLDGLAEADLVGEEHALAEGLSQREERGINLVRLEVDARVGG